MTCKNKPGGTDIVTAQDVRIEFHLPKTGQTLKAVDGVSFSVRQGEVFGIIGESGSGKSTLARAIVRLLPPAAGEIRHFGRDVYALRGEELRQDRREFQIVFQDPSSALDPRMSILRSVREPLDIEGRLPKAERNQRAIELLSQVGIRPDLASRHPHQLSGGQKQRVNIARSLALNPKLLVCDEVVSALDVSIQADVLNLFADLQEARHLTYIFITHDLGVASHISDRLGVMYLGRLMEIAPTRDLVEKPFHPYTQALLSAELSVLPAKARQRIVLKGEIPSPISPPSGCRFRTRCPRASARCAAEEPAWREIKPGRWVSCHFPIGDEAASGETVLVEAQQ